MSSLEKGSSQGKFIYGLWTKSDLIPLISVHLPLDLHPVMVDVKGKSLGLNSLSLVPARCVPWHVPCLNPLLKSSTASTKSIKLLLLGVVRTFLFFALQDIDVLFESWAVHVADSLAGNMHLDLHQLEREDNRVWTHSHRSSPWGRNRVRSRGMSCSKLCSHPGFPVSAEKSSMIQGEFRSF